MFVFNEYIKHCKSVYVYVCEHLQMVTKSKP